MLAVYLTLGRFAAAEKMLSGFTAAAEQA